jgi:hypothetical protein
MSLEVLASSIEEVLKIKATDGTVAEKRREFARQIAEAIEVYVQEQIGIRLSKIKTAIIVPCPTQTSITPVSPTEGQDYADFIRTTKNNI